MDRVRSHLDLDPFYCRPGIEGAHEKGGVEGQIGWFRRNPLVPVPEVDSLAELNALVDKWDADDESRLADVQSVSIERCSDLAEPFCAQLAPVWESVTSVPAPRCDHRQHQDPALA